MSKQLDLLLINPSSRGVYQEEQEKADYPALEPPYLAALIAEFIRNRGYAVNILDANVLGLTTEQTAKQIEDINPILTHIVVHGNQPSASSQLMDWVINLGRKTKESNSNTKILLTGTHPAALPRLTLEEKSFDFVGRGEGFSTPLGLLQKTSFSKIHGLWYKENEKILRGLPEKLMSSEELSKNLPKAAWDLLPMKKYRAHDWHCLEHLDERQPYAAIYTSFGCLFNCNFCCINSPFDEEGTLPHRIRLRNFEKVADEIEYLVKEHNIKNLKIVDEMFVLNKKHYLGLSNELIKRDLGKNLNIWAYARIDTIKEDYLSTLKKAGINWLALGIESGSDHVRNGVEKGGRFDYRKIKENVKKVQENGIHVVGNFIFGLPDDNLQSMQETLDLALDLNCERPNFYSTMAYPGSELHRLAQKTSSLFREKLSSPNSQEGMLQVPKDWDINRALLPEDMGGPGWIGYSQHAYECWPLPTKYLHPEQVLAFRDKTLSKAFQNPGYKIMLTKKFGRKIAEDFSKINSKVPTRMILGSNK